MERMWNYGGTLEDVCGDFVGKGEVGLGLISGGRNG